MVRVSAFCNNGVFEYRRPRQWRAGNCADGSGAGGPRRAVHAAAHLEAGGASSELDRTTLWVCGAPGVPRMRLDKVHKSLCSTEELALAKLVL